MKTEHWIMLAVAALVGWALFRKPAEAAQDAIFTGTVSSPEPSRPAGSPPVTQATTGSPEKTIMEGLVDLGTLGLKPIGS